MEPAIITAAISAVVGIVSSVFSYMIASQKARKDILVTDRQQLSQDQQQLRQEMREELKYWRDRYDKLEEQMDSLIVTNIRLQAEVELWKEKYERIARENELLTARVSELEEELKRRRKGASVNHEEDQNFLE